MIENIYYINLKHRNDRDEKLLSELTRMGFKQDSLMRIEGIENSLNGTKGCCQSHIMALSKAKEQSCKNVLILEDDAAFVQSKNTLFAMLNYFFKNIKKWDVLYLGDFILEKRKTKFVKIVKITKALRTHAYLVNGHYLDVLKKCFEESLEAMESQLFFSQSFYNAIDRAWQKLQLRDNWYGFDINLLKQARSFSDIEKINKDR